MVSGYGFTVQAERYVMMHGDTEDNPYTGIYTNMEAATLKIV